MAERRWRRWSRGSWEAEVEEGAAGEVRDNDVLRGWGQGGGMLWPRGRGRQVATAASEATGVQRRR
jgi:hypothetical protein